MSAPVLFHQFDNQYLIVRDSELWNGVHGADSTFTTDNQYLVIAPHRVNDRFLNSCPFGYFLIHNFETDMLYDVPFCAVPDF